MKKRNVIFLRGLFVFTLLLSASGCKFALSPEARPNFIIIVTDDQRYDTMEYMPNTQHLIFEQGVTFTNGFVTTPLCCPSRSSILTGMYAHHHGVLNNDEKLQYPTFVEILHAGGYYTGLIGKYLNSWKGEARPEYDYWVSYFKGQTPYYKPYLNVNGEWIQYGEDEYITYLLGDYVVKFLDTAARQDKPFFLLFTPNAPHEPVTPANEDLALLTDLPPHRPPSFNEENLADKPAWLASRPPLTEEEITDVDEFRRNQLLTLVALDRVIARIIAELTNNGLLDNTVVIFLSDNGKFWGEHRLTSKNGVYEEASRVPFAVRYPPLIPVPYVDTEHIVSNIDIAPTILELANIPVPASMDGMSLVDLLSGNTDWREGILLEGWPPRGAYSAVHTKRYVYVETVGDKAEFYDLQIDPYQMENLIEDPAYQELIEYHKELLAKLYIHEQ